MTVNLGTLHAKVKVSPDLLPCCTLSFTAASVSTSGKPNGHITVHAAGVSQSDLLHDVASQFGVGDVIDAIGEDVIADELESRKRRAKAPTN